MITFDAFILKYKYKYIDFDGKYGPQCKDLFSAYNKEVVGNPNYVKGNAKDIINTYPKDYYTRVDKPQKGDVVIWDIGAYGHIAIFYEKDGSHFTSFDQNYPEGSYCCFYHHTYRGVTGYLRPLINKDILKELNMTYDELVEKLKREFVQKDDRFNFVPETGATEICNNYKKYKYGTSPDDDKILANRFCKENISEAEKKFKRTKNRGDVL